MTGQEIKSLRETLGESREIFGTRFAVSKRTVESWEHGLRRPSKLTVRLMLRLAVRQAREGVA